MKHSLAIWLLAAMGLCYCNTMQAMTAESDSSLCIISNDGSAFDFCLSDVELGDRAVIYFDLENCRESSTDAGYPFELVSARFSLYEIGTVVWPMHLDIVVYDRVANGHQCDGPGAELCRIPVACDSTDFCYPTFGTVVLPNPCCLRGPFFIGVEYTETQPTPFPSLVVDHHYDVPERCKAWLFDSSIDAWTEWGVLFFSNYLTGFPVIQVEVRPKATNCSADCFQVGDLDDNGLFDISDCALYSSWLSGGGFPNWLYRLDTNADCEISTAEKAQPQSYCFGPFPEPPPPDQRCTCPKPWVESCDCKPGDADGNNLYTISDAVYLINFIFAGGAQPMPFDVCSGDADGNCLVTISDAVFLINYVFAGGAAPYNCLYWPLDCGGVH